MFHNLRGICLFTTLPEANTVAIAPENGWKMKPILLEALYKISGGKPAVRKR